MRRKYERDLCDLVLAGGPPLRDGRAGSSWLGYLVYAQTREILIAPGAESPIDGIPIEDENSWCLIRASGTEPKIWFTAEGTDPAHAKAMIRAGHDPIRT